MVADEQTQRLPSDDDDAEALRASSAASRPSRPSQTALTAHAEASCSAITRCCSRRGRSLTSEVGNLVFTGTTDDPGDAGDAAAPRLPATRSSPPRRCAAGISAAAPAITSARAREVLTELDAGPARGARRHRRSRRARSPPSTAPSARMPAGGRAADHPAIARPPAPALRRPSRHGAAARRDRGAERRMCSTRIIDPAFVEPVDGRARHRGPGAPDRSASRPHFEDFLDRTARRGAPDALPRRRAAPVRHLLARPGRAGLCGDRARRSSAPRFEAVRDGFEAEHGTRSGRTIAIARPRAASARAS